MDSFFRLTLCSAFLATLGTLSASAAIERVIDKTFAVAPGSIVRVDLSGAPIRASVGPAGTAHILLKETVHTDDAAEAEKLRQRFEISCTQEGGEVRLVVKEKRSLGFDWLSRRKVEFHPEITVPADVQLDLDTSGGSITVEGEMKALVKADTSGGRIDVAGGTSLNLDTSGGGIHVGRALGELRADTSGGGITVDYIGPDATNVNLDTSGGSIHAGVDPAARLAIVADTSAGSVTVEGFASAFEVQHKESDHVTGRLNGGAGTLRADTSGGSIRIRSASK